METAFGIQIPPEVAREISTVQKVVHHISQKLESFCPTET
jgi:acyl carrier protein